MRTNTQETVLSAYIVSIGKRTPREAAQDAAGHGRNEAAARKDSIEAGNHGKRRAHPHHDEESGGVAGHT